MDCRQPVEIRQLAADELELFARIYSSAFPGDYTCDRQGWQSATQSFQMINEVAPHYRFYGLFAGSPRQLVAGYLLMPLTAVMFGREVSIAALTGVAVDWRYKQSGLARQLTGHFVDQGRHNGWAIGVLFPFDTGYYLAKGFGYYSNTYFWEFKPGQLRPGTPAGLWEVDASRPEQRARVEDIYHRYARGCHGAICRNPLQWLWFWQQPGMRTVVAADSQGVECGYLAVRPLLGAGAAGRLQIVEWVCLSGEGRDGLREFLRRQCDQYQQVVYETDDRSFGLQLDWRGTPGYGETGLWGHKQAIMSGGFLARCFDERQIWAALSGREFGEQAVRLGFTVNDGLSGAGKRLAVEFDGGRATVSDNLEKTDGWLDMGWGDYTSLLVNSLTFDELYRSGRLHLSGRIASDRLERLFCCTRRPEVIAKI